VDGQEKKKNLVEINTSVCFFETVFSS